MLAKTERTSHQNSTRGQRSHTPVVQVIKELPTKKYAIVKGVGEFLFALVLLTVCAPIILLTMLLVKLTSRGPALYSQVRVGKNGRPYSIYKIRTMVHECESLTGPRWSTADDPRVTSIGTFLRRSHLDELPQLWNVLSGNMSLVGPRPERPEFVPHLETTIPYYRERLLVRPGITGLAQIQLPADTNLESVCLKLAYDRFYVHRYSLMMDLQIILATGFNLLGLHFSVSQRLFRVPAGKMVEARYGSPLPDFEAAANLQTA